MTENIAYRFEVYNDRTEQWTDTINRKHPEEVYEHLAYRNVRKLVDASDLQELTEAWRKDAQTDAYDEYRAGVTHTLDNCADELEAILDE
jgi:hypothetical protein